MKAYKCDRCGKLFEKYEGQGTRVFYNITTDPYSTGNVLDLCPECNDRLQKWVDRYTTIKEAIKADKEESEEKGMTEIDTEIDFIQPKKTVGKLISTDILDKIRAEIEALPKTYPFVNHIDMYVKEDDVKKIIDKYKEEYGEVAE